MQIFAGVPWASNGSVVVENGDFRLFRSLSSEHFTYMATQQLSRLSMTLAIFQGHLTVLHQIFQERYVIRQYTTNSKSYTSFRLVPLLMTLTYI